MSDWPLNLAGFESAARDRLPQMVYDYYAGGALDEITLRANRDAYDEIALRYRVLVHRGNHIEAGIREQFDKYEKE